MGVCCGSAHRQDLQNTEKAPSKEQQSSEANKGEEVLKNIFAGMDVDSDKKVTIKELNVALRQSDELQQLFDIKYLSSKGKGKGVAAPPPPKFFENLVKQFDKDEDEMISYQEFVDYFLPKLDGKIDSVESWAALWKAFNEVDSDHSQKISAKELNTALRNSSEIQQLFNFEYYKKSSKGKGKGAPPLPAVFENIVREFDADGDNLISWKEFVDYFRAPEVATI